MSVLSNELREWLQPGHAGVLATADASGVPEVVRVFAYHAVPGQDAIRLWLLRSSAQTTVRHLTTGARAAFNAIEIPSYRSRTFKGECTVEREVGSAHDDGLITECLAAAGRSFARVGMPEDAIARMIAHAGEDRGWVDVLLHVDSVYDQSPKPGAGARL
jgi:hypothetical protein